MTHLKIFVRVFERSLHWQNAWDFLFFLNLLLERCGRPITCFRRAMTCFCRAVTCFHRAVTCFHSTVLHQRELVRIYTCWNPVSRVAHKFCNAEFTSNSLWTLRRPRARVYVPGLRRVVDSTVFSQPGLTLEPDPRPNPCQCFLNSFYFQQNNLALIYQASNYWIKLYLTIPDQASVLC